MLCIPLAGLFGGCGDPNVIVPEILSVVTILPSHGSTGIATEVSGLVYFSHEIADLAEAGDAITIECVGSPPCKEPDDSSCPSNTTATVTHDPSSQVARVSPTTPLLDDTCYVFVVAKGIEAADKEVAPLQSPVRSSFQTE